MKKLEIKVYFLDERSKHGPTVYHYSAEAVAVDGQSFGFGLGKSIGEALDELENSLEHSDGD